MNLKLLCNAFKVPKQSVLRLVTGLLCLSSLTVKAQSKLNGEYVSLNVKNRPIAEVFKQVERQTNYRFSYDNNELNTSTAVTLNLANAPINEVLEKLSQRAPVEFKKQDQDILVKQQHNTNTVADEILIKGTVRDENGQPLPGVTILIKNSSKSTATDINGNFSIQASEGSFLVAQMVGFKIREIQITKKITTLNLILNEETKALGEVVVTALGIKKEKAKIAFATQEVKGAEMEKARESNVLSSLNGKVAGLSIYNSSTLFETPSLTLRGGNPLIVIDGVPTRTDFWNLNPDDIESVNVLKSNAAGLLYGGLGKEGAIMITTKKGKGGANGVEVSFNTSTQFQAGFLRIPETQDQYGMGWNGQYAFKDGRGGGTYDDYGYVWGPKLNQKDPNTASGFVEIPQYNSPVDPNTGNLVALPWVTRSQSNLEKFLRNELLNTTNFSLAGKTDRSDYRISLSHVYQRGQVPNTKLNSTTLNLAGGLKITEKLKAEATVSYNKQYTPNYPSTGYGPNNFFYNIVLWMGPEVDINDMRNYWKAGKQDLNQQTYNYTWYNNPWFLANEYLKNYTNDVVVSQANLTYDITKDLSFLIRGGATVNNALSDTKTPYSFINYGTSKSPFGQYSLGSSNNLRLVTDALLTYKKSFLKDFSATISAGASDRYEQSKSLNSNTVGGLSVPGSYNLANSRDPIQSTNNLIEREVKSVYGYADIAYKNMVYFNLSGRNDWSSALQKPYNSFFYPSASLGLIVSEMVKMPSAISFVKLRSAYADVSSDPTAYYTLPTYSRGTRWNGTPSLNLPGSIYDPALKPNRTISREVGTELKFFSNRIGVDFTYYNYLDKNSIRTIPLSQASGYSSLIINGDVYNRKGIELILSATPVKSNNLKWDIAFNYSRLRNYVKEYFGGDSIRDGVKLGERTDVYRGWAWERSPDGKIVMEGGLPKYINQAVNMGYTGHDWDFGITNNIAYKNFNLSFSFDGRIGGKMYNGLEAKLFEGGMHKSTANQYRDDSYAGKATYLADGVVVTEGAVEYDPQGNIISDTRKFAPNTTKVDYVDWVMTTYTNGIDEANLYDKTFVKLREVALTYNVSPKLLKKTPFSSANFSVVGRNLLLFTKVPFMDPDGYDGFDLAEPTYRNIGFNLNLKF
ncbi:SusC/RagA family TonB-linked outer membrane protein [Solitalea lacus]|uniref:SusC/RagA family TonB-linked outer membrane protein n=1 Tax=Solitalea lacus TaxID=2911172 RepID=UPI001EDA5B80|nr:SusC/RagA family TonB-linked outer membrane protein [Solitalea lacus]UKJ06813.1 SusC/RagA family TonB-linked outer membrane protein [Solitalea lacus]